MRRNVASQVVGAQMVTAADGSAFTGAVTCYVTGDGGTQAAGGTGSGACTHEGNGFHSYVPTQAETNYAHVAFTFTGTGAIPATVQVYPQQRSATGYVGIDLSNMNLTAGASYALGIVDSGTAQAVGATSIQLRAAASIANDSLIGATIILTDGTNAGASGVVTDYDGTTDTATIGAGWSNAATPTGTPTYIAFGTAPVSGGTAIASAVLNAAVGSYITAGTVGERLNRIPNAAPGAAGGLFIAGSNAATTVNFTGNLSGSVGSVLSVGASAITSTSFATDAITGAKISTDAGTKLANALLASTVETGATVVQSMRLWNAALAGTSEGLGTTAPIYHSLDGTKDRITATVDSLGKGNRSAVTRDLT